MKKLLALIPILFSLNLAHGNSRYVTLIPSNPSETVLSTDVIEIVWSSLNARAIFKWSEEESFTLRFNETDQMDRNISPIGKHILTGVSQIDLVNGGGLITLKITPAATTVTTSKPVMIPPTSASDDTVNVQLQVSTDLKNWEDVASGEFLGSDTLRFFRIKATTGNPE
jgi:hypothetical protein